MLVVAGTLPIKGLPLTKGIAEFRAGKIVVRDQTLSVIQGVATLIASASVSCKALGLPQPYVIVAGDIGRGDGSRAIYEFLKRELSTLLPKTLVIHYLKPNIHDVREVIDVVEKQGEKPLLIADAGAMYVAKAAGISNKFDLLTPDLGEMAFLADPEALHPAYARHFFFEVDVTEVPKLIRQAFKHGNSSKFLIVKGPVDYIAEKGEVVASVDKPNIPEMEAIGGTGDTLTGIVSALAHSQRNLVEAATCAARVNRVAGELLNPTAATQVSEMIPLIPTAIKIL